MGNQNNKKITSIELFEDIKKKAQRLLKEEGRTLTWLLNTMLSDWVSKKEKKQND